jgi:hypothetical protein
MVSDAISLIHSAFMPHPERGVSLLLGVAFLSGGNTTFVGLKDR